MSLFLYRYTVECACMNTAICAAHLGQAIHMPTHSLLLLLVVVVFFCARTIARLNSIEREISRVSVHRHTHTWHRDFIYSAHCGQCSCRFSSTRSLFCVYLSISSFSFSYYYASKNLNENCRRARECEQEKKRNKQKKTLPYDRCLLSWNHEIIWYFVLSDFFYYDVYHL